MAAAGKLESYPAGTPELVRSNQKDLYYRGYITSLLSDLTEPLLPRRYWLLYQRELQLLAELLYYSLTTLNGNQTLGEEYCNIVQTNGPAVPSLSRRIVSVVLHVTGRYALEKGAGFIKKYTTNSTVEYIMRNVEEIMKISNQIHLSFFYLFGVYQWLSKRITSIRYLMIRYSLSEMPPNPYKLLGILIIMQLAIKLMSWIRNSLWSHEGNKVIVKKAGMSNGGVTVSSIKCSLCFENCTCPTVPPCGHLYCWSCIIEWVSEKGNCPLCRNPTQPRQCVPLQNFQ